jgi:hypothetical protein
MSETRSVKARIREKNRLYKRKQRENTNYRERENKKRRLRREQMKQVKNFYNFFRLSLKEN